MDATGTSQAILVGLSLGGLIACVLAAHHSDRVKAAIIAGTAALIGPAHSYMMPQHFQARQQQFEGWNKYNRAHWLADYPDFAEHFVRSIFSEPHSTKQIEDGIGWANETNGSVLVKTVEGTFDRTVVRRERSDVPQDLGRSAARHPRRQRSDPAAWAWQASGRAERRRARHHRRRRPQSALGRYPARCNALINDFLDRRLAIPGARPAEEPRAGAEEGALSLVADRAGPRPARHRCRPRTAQAPSRPAGRLAGAGSGDAVARSGRREGPSTQCPSRQRVAAHRGGVRRARSPCFPGDPAHGRAADRELHAFSGCR